MLQGFYVGEARNGAVGGSFGTAEGCCVTAGGSTSAGSEDDVPIEVIPGCSRLGWRHGLLDEDISQPRVGIQDCRRRVGDGSPISEDLSPAGGRNTLDRRRVGDPKDEEQVSVGDPEEEEQERVGDPSREEGQQDRSGTQKTSLHRG